MTDVEKFQISPHAEEFQLFPHNRCRKMWNFAKFGGISNISAWQVWRNPKFTLFCCCKICFVTNYAVFGKSVLARFTHFCVEKNRAKNWLGWEKWQIWGMLIAFVWTHFWELKFFLGLARHFQSIGWHFGKNFLGGAAVQYERQSQGAQKSLRWNSGSGRAPRFVVYHKSIFTAVVDELARMTVSLSCSKNCKDGFERVIVNMWLISRWFTWRLPSGTR